MADFSRYVPDIIIAATVIVFTVVGYKRGLMRSVVGLLSLVASVVLAWLLWPVVAGWLESVGVRAFFAELVQSSLSGGTTDTAMNLPLALRNMAETGQQELAGGLAQIAASLAVNVIAFVLVLVASRLIIKVVTTLLDLATKLPVIKLLNRTAGAALGVFEGLALVYIVLAIIYAAVPFNDPPNIETAIENSVIANPMYENNFIVSLLGLENADGSRNGE